jgi:type I restriction enzyme S subunit
MSTLGDLTVPKIDQSGPSKAGEFTYIDISSIDNRIKRIVEPKRLPASAAPSRAKQRLQPGDVLVSMTRPNLNAVAIVSPDLEGAVGSTGFHVLRAVEGIESRWLLYAVQTHDFVETMSSLVQGALYPAVRPKDIRAFGIEAPPLDEQRLIVAEIEKQFSRLDEAVANLKRVKANLKRYKASVLKAAVEGELTAEWRKQHPNVEPASKLLERILAEREKAFAARNRKYKAAIMLENSLSALPDKWSWASWDQLTVWITYGFTRPMPHVEHGIPIVTAKHVLDGRIDIEATERTTASAFKALSQKDKPIKGDILITKDGTIGRSALVDCDTNFCINQSVAVAWFCSEKFNRRFLRLIIESPFTQRLIWAKARGVAIQHLSITDFARMPLPFPPLLEQEEIVAEVERRLSVIEELEASVEANLTRADRLRQSILSQAFSGRLLGEGSKHVQDIPPTFSIAAESQAKYIKDNHAGR